MSNEEHSLIDIDFKYSPSAYRALISNASFAGIMGPVGCLRGDTKVITEEGLLPISLINRPMRVLSWNDQTGQFQFSLSGGAFPKGKDYLYRVQTTHGEYVAAGHHLVFCEGNAYRHVRNLLEGDIVLGCCSNLRHKLLGGYFEGCGLDAQNYLEKDANFLGDYAELCRLYGLPLLVDRESDRSSVPSQDDVQTLSSNNVLDDCVHEDGLLELSQEHIHQDQSFGLKRIDDFSLPVVRPDLGVLHCDVSKLSEYIEVKDQQSLQSLSKSVSRLKGIIFSLYYRSLKTSICECSILSIEKLESKEIFWDLQVMDTNNYVTIDGSIHHNSGKSHGCSAWVLAHANMQRVQKDGYRKSRYAVIRNTGPELKSTTIKTFEGIFPAGPHGRPVYSAPITYRINFPPQKTGGRIIPGIDCEVIFLALDNVQDIRKLLSLELTGAFINEGREIVAPVVDALIGRIGRYPSMAQGGCVNPQVIADTNAPDEDSWWFNRFENNNMPQKFVLPDGREIDLTNKLFKQPPAVLELKEISGDRFESVERGYEYIYEKEEVIYAAGKWWGINPDAENLPNLDPAYYARQLIGSNLKYIQVMLQAKYGFYQIGKPVIPEFNHDLQVVDIPILKDTPLILGIDIGGGTLQPAAVIGQRHPRGNWLIHSECIGSEMGVENFSRILAQHIHERYEGINLDVLWLDPAAEQRDQLFEHKIVEYMRAAPHCFPTRCASTNDWRVRRQAIADPCGRLIDGKPGLLISKTGCPKLINGLKGKWDFKKLQTSGVEAFAEYPSKNEYSHPCDALGYLLLGGGEAKPMQTNKTPQQRKAWGSGFTAKQNFNL